MGPIAALLPLLILETDPIYVANEEIAFALSTFTDTTNKYVCENKQKWPISRTATIAREIVCPGVQSTR